MELNIFEFDDYRDYLNQLSGPKSKKSGMKAALARAAYTFNSYISKVLNKDGHLTLEQAEDISSYLNHSENEKLFFFLLIQKGRAGTQKLRKHFENEIEKIRRDRLVLSKELKSEQKIRPETEAQYYSSWLYTAVDVALMIPDLRTREALSTYFNIPPVTITKILEFLTSVGLIEFKNGKYSTTTQHMHLRHDSPNIVRHHSNWRLKTMEKLESDPSTDTDLHYSAAITLSERDFSKLKAMIVDFLKETNKLIDPSPAETIATLCIDLYNLR